MNTLWNAVGASVRGTSHLKSGVPCQDACAYMVTESGVLLAAVSDGAGSAELAHIGAQQAVDAAVQALYGELTERIPETHRRWGRLLYDSFSRARNAVLELAGDEPGEARRYAATLSIVVADHEWLATGQLGDGLSVVRTADGALHTVGEPQRGEYAGSTYFLTEDGAPETFYGRVYLQGADIAPVLSLAIMTDGLTGLALDRSTGLPHPPFFTPLLQVPAGIEHHDGALADLQAFLASERVNGRTDDDKTLLLAGRPGR